MKEKIKELGKRLLTIAVALAMVVTCIPGTAFGAETSEKVKKNVMVPDTFTKAAQEEETTLDALKKLIEEADELKEEDYTAESWAEFKDVRDSIDDPDEIPERFQQTILNNLQEAIDGLQKTTLKQLKDLIAEADQLNESDYTAESWAEFKDVRDSINNPDEIPEKFQQTILNNLQEVIDGLQKTTLKQLKDLIAGADQLNESDYTAESWAKFKDVRDSIDNPDEIPEKFQQTVLNNLQKAIDNLKPAQEESEERKQLKELITKADQLNESDYTAESWAEFWNVRDSIEDVDEIPDQFVGTVLKNLQEAMDNLKPAQEESEERKQLKELITKADQLNESDYTAESWAEFWNVRDSIEDVDEIPDQFVGTVLKNLQEAMDNLKPAQEESEERKQLKALIEKADKLNESDYTAESWAEFKDVRESIEDVDEIPDQYVGIVLQNLQEAIDNLEPAKAESEERKQLKALIEKTDKLNESDYTAES